jgi:hypothetical protein
MVKITTHGGIIGMDAIQTKSVQTFTATIYVGMKVRDTGNEFTLHDAHSIAQLYCDEHKLCVTVTPTHFVYTSDNEPGVAVGLINYPRFPSTPEVIGDHAIKLAEIYLKAFKQYKVCVVFPGQTVMLSQEPFGHSDPRK